MVRDTVGGETLEQSWDVLRAGEALISIAGTPLQERAAKLGLRAAFFIVEPNPGQLARIARLVDLGAVRPLVEEVFPLARAREAYERVARGHTRGKLVLQVMEHADERSGTSRRVWVLSPLHVMSASPPSCRTVSARSPRVGTRHGAWVFPPERQEAAPSRLLRNELAAPTIPRQTPHPRNREACDAGCQEG